MQRFTQPPQCLTCPSVFECVVELQVPVVPTTVSGLAACCAVCSRSGVARPCFHCTLAVMGRVRKVTGEDVMTEDEFAAWWEEHHLEGDIFIDALRRDLARRLQVKNFRQLALVFGDQMLGQESRWIDADLVLVVRPYLTDTEEEGKELLKAAYEGDVQSVVSLLERPLDPDVEAVDPEASDQESTFTPLRAAADRSHLEVMRCLLACGADMDKADCEGDTAMHAAAFSSSADMTCCLLAARADTNKANSDGWTALHCAAQWGNLEAVRCLLEAGAEKTLVNNEGQTPWDYAVACERPDIACLLDEGESAFAEAE